MIELSTIQDLVAIFGVIAGFNYYVLTVQNQRKARQAQLFIQIYQSRCKEGGINGFSRIALNEIEWLYLVNCVECFLALNGPT